MLFLNEMDDYKINNGKECNVYAIEKSGFIPSLGGGVNMVLCDHSTFEGVWRYVYAPGVESSIRVDLRIMKVINNLD